MRNTFSVLISELKKNFPTASDKQILKYAMHISIPAFAVICSTSTGLSKASNAAI